jgi:rod shape determining protein RodA
MMMFDRRLLKNYGWALFILTLTFLIIGLINLYSASFQTEYYVFKKQLVWVNLGLIGMILVSFLDFKTIKRYTTHIYAITTIFLIITLLFGREVAGSKSWISLGHLINIQPSEFAKLTIIIALAKFYDNDFDPGPYGIRDLVKPILIVAIPVVLVMLQPDLGTAFVIILISGSIIFFMGIRVKSLLFLFIVIIGLSFSSWQFLFKDYQKERIVTFIDSSQDPLGSGYNAIQSQIAVGSGKFLGKGFKSGSQTQLRFIPAQKTDFVFSVLAEEWGFVGAIITLVIYFLIILWILDTASGSKDKFTMLICFGIAAMYFWHIVINVGMVIGILPVTGVPMLLLSYGGSSTISSLLGIGIVLGIRMRRTPLVKEALDLA